MIQAIVPHQNSTLRDRRVLINKAYSLSHRSSISTLHWLDSAEQVAVRSSSLSLAQLLIGINCVKHYLTVRGTPSADDSFKLNSSCHPARYFTRILLSPSCRLAKLPSSFIRSAMHLLYSVRLISGIIARGFIS